MGLAPAACGPPLLRAWSGSPELPRGRYGGYQGDLEDLSRRSETVKSARVAERDTLVFQAVKLTSSRTQLPYEYYSLPFCKPKAVFYKGENLGEHNRFVLAALQSGVSQVLCFGSGITLCVLQVRCCGGIASSTPPSPSR